MYIRLKVDISVSTHGVCLISLSDSQSSVDEVKTALAGLKSGQIDFVEEGRVNVAMICVMKQMSQKHQGRYRPETVTVRLT